MALTQEAAGEALGEAGVRPAVGPGARCLRAGDTNPPGSRPGCRGGPHGHLPTPPPAPAGAAPVRAWWGRGTPRPRPHAGYSPAALSRLHGPHRRRQLPLPALIPDTRLPAWRQQPPWGGASCSRTGRGGLRVPPPLRRAWGPTETSRLHGTGTVPGWPQAAAAAVGHGVAAVLVQAVPSRVRPLAPPCCRGAALGGLRSSRAPTDLPRYTRETTGQGEMTPLLLPPQTKSCWQCRGKEPGRAVPSTRPSSHLCVGRAGSFPMSKLLPAPP